MARGELGGQRRPDALHVPPARRRDVLGRHAADRDDREGQLRRPRRPARARPHRWPGPTSRATRRRPSTTSTRSRSSSRRPNAQFLQATSTVSLGDPVRRDRHGGPGGAPPGRGRRLGTVRAGGVHAGPGRDDRAPRRVRVAVGRLREPRRGVPRPDRLLDRARVGRAVRRAGVRPVRRRGRRAAAGRAAGRGFGRRGADAHQPGGRLRAPAERDRRPAGRPGRAGRRPGGDQPPGAGGHRAQRGVQAGDQRARQHDARLRRPVRRARVRPGRCRGRARRRRLDARRGRDPREGRREAVVRRRLRAAVHGQPGGARAGAAAAQGRRRRPPGAPADARGAAGRRSRPATTTRTTTTSRAPTATSCARSSRRSSATSTSGPRTRPGPAARRPAGAG